MKKLSLLLFILMNNIFSSCNKPENIDTNFQILKDYLYESHDYALPDNVKAIFVLTEKGCSGCNQQFSQFMAKNIEKNNTAFIVLSRGKMIDISIFNKGKNNVFFDDFANIKNNLLRKTKCFLVKNKRIFKIIEIESEKLEAQINDIKKYLNN